MVDESIRDLSSVLGLLYVGLPHGGRRQIALTDWGRSLGGRGGGGALRLG